MKSIYVLQLVTDESSREVNSMYIHKYITYVNSIILNSQL